MSKAAYWHSFWHIRPQPGFYELLEPFDIRKAVEGIYKPKEKENK